LSKNYQWLLQMKGRKQLDETRERKKKNTDPPPTRRVTGSHRL
jgi:hypothetical protein